MSSESRAALLDIIIFIVGIALLIAGGAALIYAEPGSAWPLIPSILSILCFGWVATGISNIIYNL